MKTTSLILWGLLCGSAAVHATQPLLATGRYGSNNTSQLYRIDDYTNAPKAVAIGDTGYLLSDLAVDPTTFTIYAIDSDSTLFILNPTNGAASPVGPLGVANQSAFVFDTNGQAYCWGGMFLYSINKQTGAATTIGATTNGGSVYYPGGDLAFDTNGVLYGSSSSGELLIIDKNNARVTPRGYFNVGSIWGLEIDTDGKMYAAANGSGRVKLYTVNKQTGAATNLIGTVDFNFYCDEQIGGLSFAGSRRRPTQPSTSIYTAVEVAWTSETNRLYQLQWASMMADTNTWFNLGPPVVGNGSTNSILQSIKATQKRFYRVVALE